MMLSLSNTTLAERGSYDWSKRTFGRIVLHASAPQGE